MEFYQNSFGDGGREYITGLMAGAEEYGAVFKKLEMKDESDKKLCKNMRIIVEMFINPSTRVLYTPIFLAGILEWLKTADEAYQTAS